MAYDKKVWSFKVNTIILAVHYSSCKYLKYSEDLEYLHVNHISVDY